MSLNDSNNKSTVDLTKPMLIFYDDTAETKLRQTNPALVNFLQQRQGSNTDYFFPNKPYRLSISRKIETIDFLKIANERYFLIYNSYNDNYNYTKLEKISSLDYIKTNTGIRQSILKNPYILETFPAIKKTNDVYFTTSITFHLIPVNELTQLIEKIDKELNNDMTQTDEALKNIDQYLKI